MKLLEAQIMLFTRLFLRITGRDPRFLYLQRQISQNLVHLDSSK